MKKPEKSDSVQQEMFPLWCDQEARCGPWAAIYGPGYVESAIWDPESQKSFDMSDKGSCRKRYWCPALGSCLKGSGAKVRA